MKVSMRKAVLGAAAVRGALGLVAIPLAPVLYRDHFVVLVLLRPTKEVLLAGGFLVRAGDVGLAAVVAAAVPLALVGVWHFFVLGRLYAREIQRGDALPGWAQRLMPPDRIGRLCRVLARKGGRVIVLGRLAAFPSALLGAAAGASRMEPRSFLVADLAGCILSVVEVMGAGYLLGAAYKEAGPWITAAGVVVLVAVLVLVGRSLRRED
jgi:membrane protein DedA with SNARE-associated domain